jgi:Transposase
MGKDCGRLEKAVPSVVQGARFIAWSPRSAPISLVTACPWGVIPFGRMQTAAPPRPPCPRRFPLRGGPHAERSSEASPPWPRGHAPPELRRVNRNAAGVDVGAGSHYVAVPNGRDPAGGDGRAFRAFTADLYALADWLTRGDIATGAMEATGVYWIPVFELLSARGLEVRLVDPRQLKHVPGRKTDVLDCQWVQQLDTFGLLTAAFRPADQVCVLRSYLRQRAMLVTYAAHHLQHMQTQGELL